MEGQGRSTQFEELIGDCANCALRPSERSERQLTLELIRAMADRKPERVVCLDEGFAGNDQLKANAVQIFKTKGVVSFKTV